MTGAIRLGLPMLLRSPVRFTSDSKSRAVDDGRMGGPTDTAQAYMLGDAALVPLLLSGGKTVGLMRVSLVAPIQETALSLDYVLFDEPVAKLMTATEAATAVGRPTARVMAVALDSQNHYDPFQFHWAVEPTTKNSAPTMLSPGLPALITQRGERVMAQSAEVSALNTQALRQPITPAQARQAYLRYQSTLAGLEGDQR